MEKENILKDKKIAILATDGFEEIELTAPQKKLSEFGALTHLVSNEKNIKSWNNKQWGDVFIVDKLYKDINLSDYDLLLLPGGVINADRLRRNQEIVNGIKEFYSQNKPVAAICHGPQLLIEADIVHGKKIAAHEAIKKDITNAGASFTDIGVYKDGKIISARGIKDIPFFIKEIITTIEN